MKKSLRLRCLTILSLISILLSCSQQTPQTIVQPPEIRYQIVEVPLTTTVLPEGLSWPIEGPVVITSPFGRRSDLKKTATGGGDSLHEGIDIVPADRTKIHILLHAMGDGKVVTVFGPRHPHQVYGICVMVRHDLGLKSADGRPVFIYSLVAHLSQVWVSVGDKVKRGDILGRMGESGMAEGYHTHVEVLFDPSDFIDFDNQLVTK